MNLRFFKILLFVLCPLLLTAQKEGNIWYFGYKAGLDFNSGIPVVLNNSAMDADGGCASISDANGNLLFYTNGQTIWNRYHNIMLNGAGLLGDNNATQTGVIVPYPGNTNLYYIFTIANNYMYNGLRYSLVDMRLDGGLGGIILKNILLLTQPTCKITAINHSNNSAIWIVTHKENSNSYYSYYLDRNGLDTIPVVSNVGSFHPLHATQGYMKVSPDGSKIGLTVTTSGGFSEVSSFNKTTGKIYNPKRIKFKNNDIRGYGVEFSPNGTKLYISSNGSPEILLQYDISNFDSTYINNSAKVIATKQSPRSFGALQVAPDGKIYVVSSNWLFLDVINNPNDTGISCNYVVDAIASNTRQGLPNFLQSYFFVPDFTAQPLCHGDSTKFGITKTTGVDSVLWNFGDGLSGIKNISRSFTPSHSYSDSGLFNVSLIIFHGTEIDTTNRIIKISPYPSTKFSVNDSIQCYNGNRFIFNNQSSLPDGGMTYEWSFGDSITDYSVNPIYSFTKDSNFNVSLIALSDYGCADTFQKNVIVRPSPISSFTVIDTSQCLNENSFQFTNQSLGFQNSNWDFGDGLFDTLNSPVHSYSIPDTFRVGLILKNIYGCKDTFSKKVIVLTSPKAEFAVNDSAQCLPNNSFLFTNTTSVVPYKINALLWDFSDGISDTIINPQHTYAIADTFNVKLSVTSELGCNDSIISQVIVEPIPKADFSVNDSIQCFQNNRFIFNNKSLNLNFAFSHFSWGFGDNTTDTAINPVHSYSTEDTFAVQLLSISEFGCKDSLTKSISFHATPKSKFVIYDSSQCLERNNFGFINTSTISSGNLSYLWNFGDGDTSILSNPSHSYLVADTFTVLLVASSDKNCVDSFSSHTYIHVHPKPLANFSVNDSSQCLSGNLFVLSNNSTIKSGTFSKKWDFADGSDTASYDASHTYSIADSYIIKLLIISDWACKDSILKQVIVYHEQATDFGLSNSSVCIGEVINFNNTSTYNFGTLTYNWDFGDGSYSIIQNPQHSYTGDSAYDVKLNSISNFGCKDSIFHKVYVNPLPKTDFIVNDTTQCLTGNSFTFTDQSSIKSGSIAQFKFDFGDGTASTLTTITHSFVTADSFLVKLVTKSNQGCSDSITKTIYVWPMPAADFSINSNPQYLPVNNYVFTNLSSGALNSYWKFGDGDTSSIKDPTHVYNTIDTFDVSLLVISINGCKDSISKKVWLLYPVINADFQLTDVCLGDIAYFHNTSTSPNDSFLNFLWDFGDGNSTNGLNDPNHLYADTGVYMVQMIALTRKGFKDTANHNIIVLPSPTIQITADPDTIVEEGIIVKLTANGVFDNILWNNGTSTNSIEVDKTGKYSVRVTSFNGCDAADSIMIIYLPKTPFSFMNVITPNGDGMNDLFKIDQIDKYQPCKLAIYNRWGDELYSSNNYQNNWDGTFKGKSLPEGTYYFVLVAKDGKVYKGAVNIVK